MRINFIGAQNFPSYELLFNKNVERDTKKSEFLKHSGKARAKKCFFMSEINHMSDALWANIIYKALADFLRQLLA